MAQVTVTVTEELVKKGIAGSAYVCPVALAFREALPDDDGMVLTVRSYTNVGTIKYMHPDNVSQFIFDFDKGIDVTDRLPLTFTVDGKDFD
jgi:hypothetical protein